VINPNRWSRGITITSRLVTQGGRKLTWQSGTVSIGKDSKMTWGCMSSHDTYVHVLNHSTYGRMTPPTSWNPDTSGRLSV
jgi:hypothetical protein